MTTTTTTMNDPSMKAEASPAAVSPSSVEANLTFTQALQAEPEVNIFVAAMRGDVDLIRELIESGKAKATDKDSSNMCVMLYFADGYQLTVSPV
jgi:palmitoyltransferase ZDHHC13/17